MNVINLKGKGPDFWNRVLKETDKYVYIGRYVCFTPFQQSKWHNPFSVKKYGRQKSIELYRKYLQDKPELVDSLHELKGKMLCCWCKPDACHGDVLVELVEKLDDEMKKLKLNKLKNALKDANEKYGSDYQLIGSRKDKGYSDNDIDLYSPSDTYLWKAVLGVGKYIAKKMGMLVEFHFDAPSYCLDFMSNIYRIYPNGKHMYAIDEVQEEILQEEITCLLLKKKAGEIK